MAEKGTAAGLIFWGEISAEVQQNLFGEVLGHIVSVDLFEGGACGVEKNADGNDTYGNFRKIPASYFNPAFEAKH
jgi:hypothetical protein